ncbi:MAG: hypothetical protein KFW09_05760 [Oscillospiraceae bacterium]|nr:hypothetical protein [Oscillospiraceae bacterium]
MLEFKILKNSKNGIMLIGSSILCFILGFILLVSLDGYSPSEISIYQLQYSIYTVYTQFGFFIFTIIPMTLVSNDYKEKNIIFYKTLNYSSLQYVLNKIVSIGLYITIGNFLLSLIISTIYISFNNFFIFFMKIQNISIFIIIISVSLAYLLSNFIKSFCSCFALWIVGIVLSTISEKFFLFAFYDATLQRHLNLQNILESNVLFDLSILSEILYNGVVFCIVLFLAIIFKKRWMKNGI